MEVVLVLFIYLIYKIVVAFAENFAVNPNEMKVNGIRFVLCCFQE